MRVFARIAFAGLWLAALSPADAAVRTAYVYANLPTSASYSPPASQRSESAGAVTIQRVSPGRYIVNLSAFMPPATLIPTPSAPPGALGNVQVKAYGATTNFCQVVSWSTNVNVACFTPAGAPADTRFAVLASLGTAGDDVAYAWASQPAAATYSADSRYALGTGGSGVTIRRTATGLYLLGLGGAAGVNANVQVSAYGGTPRRCQIANWTLGMAAVNCRDASGAPADAQFSVLALRARGGTRDFSYAWGNSPTEASSVPDSRYVYAPGATDGVSVTRLGAGIYSVRLGGAIRHAQVTAYGDDGAYCHPVGWSEGTAVVNCHNIAGGNVDTRFSLLAMNDAAAAPPGPAGGTPLFGYVDMHTHPASFLGFGGRADGRQGMMWGRPAVGDGFRGVSATERFGQCFANDHSEMDADIDNPDNFTKLKLRELIIANANSRSGHPHTARGAPGFEEWPNSLLVSHQQIDVEWLRRAHRGGLRMMVAAAVDNELVDTAYDWNFTRLAPLIGDFFAGRPLRPRLGIPSRTFGITSAREQLRFIQQMAAENCDFMAIALSGAEARSIVASGKLAIILGLEMDTLSPDDMRTLVDEEGVRFITPIHFVDNAIGGSASYEMMFSVLSGLIGASGQLQRMVNNDASDFLIAAPFGAMQAEMDRLMGLTLGWSPLGVRCPATSTTAGRLGCSGQINSLGLTPAGQTLITDMLSRGVLIDMAHMGEASQSMTLTIAERLAKPVFDSHTGMRSDRFSEGANERAIPERFARRLLNLGGVIGVGTGVGEYGDPRRVYYNAGNPLIDFRSGRTSWTLDLRQPELQQSPVPGTFSRYRVTLRIGSDNVEDENTVTATLLSRTGTLGTCVVIPLGRGADGHTVVTSPTCSITSGTFPIAGVDGLKLEHTAQNCDPGCTPDNVSIDEVIVEVDTSTPPGRQVILQRTGGNESEVVRLKAPGPDPHPNVFASHYWVTRMLPRAGDFTGGITALRVRTFTNEDDLGGSAPGRIHVALSGHRESGAQAIAFAEGGAPAGTFTDSLMTFLSGGERVLTHADRASTLSFGAITLGVGGDPSTAPLEIINGLRQAAIDGVFNQPEVQRALALTGVWAGVTVVSTANAVASWALADPLTATFAGLVIAALVEAHDNWSSLVAVDAQVGSGASAHSVPLLVGYNPMQRLKRSQPSSILFRDLPERIEASRLYSGMVISFSVTTQWDMESLNAADLQFELVFQDGTLIRHSLPAGYMLGIGPEYKTFIPFDNPRVGSELSKLRLVSTTGTVLIRTLDVGLMEDPAISFARAFAAFDGLGDHPNQIGFGTDLSGFEALTPFSAFNPGFDPLVIPPTCRGTVVAGTCRDLTIAAAPERPLPPRPEYAIDIERFAGRADPARAIAARSVPRSLTMGRVDGSSGRLLDFRLSGLSTVGQMPELAVTAAQADSFLRGSRARLGRQVFNSVEGMVSAWERLDTGATSRPTRPAHIPPCP